MEKENQNQECWCASRRHVGLRNLPINSDGDLRLKFKDSDASMNIFSRGKRTLTRLRIEAVHAIQSEATQKSHKRSDNSQTRLN